MFNNALIHGLGLLPLIYGVIVLCVVSVGVIARLISPNLIAAVPAGVGRYLSITLNIETSSETFIEKFLDPNILLNLGREFLQGKVLLDLNNRSASCLCPQRDGVVDIREKLFPGKYWSGTEP